MFSLQPVASLFDPDTIWILVPLCALMIPIVAMLISHQQKMAQIVHGGFVPKELEDLRREVEMLRQHTQYQASQIAELKAQSGLQATTTSDSPHLEGTVNS